MSLLLYLAIPDISLTAIVVEGYSEVSHEPQGCVLEFHQSLEQVKSFRISHFVVAPPLSEAFHIFGFLGLSPFRSQFEQ